MKNKFVKIAVAAATLAFAGVLAVGCSSSDSTSSSASSNASTEPAGGITKLTVGFDDSYPPYGFIGKDGEYVGFDLDLAAEVANRNGWEFEAYPIDWKAKDSELNQGSVNCLWNGFTQEGRENDYTFSQPYMLNEQVIVAKADTGIVTKDDLKGKVVITQLGSAAEELLQGNEAKLADLAATFGRLDTVADYNNAFMQLESGNVDAVICDLSIADYQMTAKPNVYVKLEEPLSSEHYVVAFKKGDDALAQIVSETLLDMYNDGTVATIAEKYAGDGLKFENWILK